MAKKKEITQENIEKDKRLSVKLERWTSAGWFTFRNDYGMLVKMFSYHFHSNFFEDIKRALKQKIKQSSLVCMLPRPPVQPPQPIAGPRNLPPPPPPPLPMPNFQAPQANLPDYLKPKKKFCVNVPLKKANWVEINARKISKNAFWANCQEEKLASEDILAGLATKFSQTSIKTTGNDSPAYKKLVTKEHISLHVISQKSSFAISILLGSSLKRVSFEHLKGCILRCDTSILNPDNIQQLIKYLPSPDQLKRLQQIKNSGGEIDQLVPRLHSIYLKIRFAEIAQDLESDIVVGTAACEEVKRSDKFAKILELILLCGNYLNSGSIRAPAFGFELSFLTKLGDTKESGNKQTLLHYIVETIEKEYHELLSFGEELSHVDRATRISLEKIHDNMQQITTPLENLNSALQILKEPQSSGDRFCKEMGDIAIRYNNQVKLLVEASDRGKANIRKWVNFMHSIRNNIQWRLSSWILKHSKRCSSKLIMKISKFAKKKTSVHHRTAQHRKTPHSTNEVSVGITPNNNQIWNGLNGRKDQSFGACNHHKFGQYK